MRHGYSLSTFLSLQDCRWTPFSESSAETSSKAPDSASYCEESKQFWHWRFACWQPFSEAVAVSKSCVWHCCRDQVKHTARVWQRPSPRQPWRAPCFFIYCFSTGGFGVEELGSEVVLRRAGSRRAYFLLGKCWYVGYEDQAGCWVDKNFRVTAASWM